jgi:protein TonB
VSRRARLVAPIRARLARLGPPPGPLRWFLAAALALHVLPFGAFLIHFEPRVPFPPDSAPSIEVEYVSRPATQKGAPPTPPTPPDQPAPEAATPASAPPTPPEQPAPDPTPQPEPAPPQPEVKAVPAAPPQASPAKSEPNVNLGNADEDLNPLTVTGDNVVESGPDARYRNMPPDYPPEAARRRQEGVVALVVHVAATGTVDSIDLVETSGSSYLDEEAIAAVRKWHFTVPIKDGVPIASTSLQSFHFTMK